MLGLERTSVANASLIVAAAPVIVAVFGTVTGIERLTAPLIGGVVLATLGVTLVVAMRGPAFGTETLVGDLAVLIATFSWAAYTLLLRKYRLGVSDLRLTALTMLTGAPGLALLGLPGFLHTDWRSVRLSAWIGVAGSTFLAIVVAYILWNRAVRQLGSARASIFSSGVPLTAMLVAWPVLGEHPRPLQIAGAVLIVGGVLLSRRKR
jgi:drug/metabolite transporter (DMT)-like permease